MKFEDDLILLRRDLHKHPELSGCENNTAQRIETFFQQFNPDQVIRQVGGHGLAFFFEGKQAGPTVLIRCELDALPIHEINEFEYQSVNNNIGHKCGHDGHMVILAGLAQKLADKRPAKGTVVLLYQPAEETGEGAREVVKDSKFASLKPDYVFALHNIPGFKKNTILCRAGTFAVASVGVTIKLKGKTSHAGEPDRGINPARAIADLIDGILDIPKNRKDFKEFVLSTIVHVNLGEIAFGTSAGYAELRATLRGNRDEDVEKIKEKIVQLIDEVSRRDQLEGSYEFVEDFPAVQNDPLCMNIIRKAAESNDFDFIEIDKPFNWSEDFSNLINISTGAMFGLGAGVETSQLHNPDYDFPDEITQAGIQMFYSIIHEILG